MTHFWVYHEGGGDRIKADWRPHTESLTFWLGMGWGVRGEGVKVEDLWPPIRPVTDTVKGITRKNGQFYFLVCRVYTLTCHPSSRVVGGGGGGGWGESGGLHRRGEWVTTAWMAWGNVSEGVGALVWWVTKHVVYMRKMGLSEWRRKKVWSEYMIFSYLIVYAKVVTCTQETSEWVREVSQWNE